MKSVLRIQVLEKPETIQLLGNNSYYYNYDIKPCKMFDVDGEEKSGWDFIPVYIQGNPNYKDCVKNTIRLYLSQEEEFDLINSYNKSIIEGVKNKSEMDYKKYLNLLDTIKDNTKNIFK